MNSGLNRRKNSATRSHSRMNSLSVEPGLHRNVELGSGGRAFACLAGVAGAWIKKPAVFVNVGDEYFGVVLVWIEKPVAVMDIDVERTRLSGCRIFHAAYRSPHRSR